MKPLVIMISVSILTYGAMLDCTPDTLVQDNACSCGRYNCGIGNICHKYNEQTYCAILSGQTQVTLCGSDSNCSNGQVCVTIGNILKICLDAYCPYNIRLNQSCNCSSSASSVCNEGQIYYNGTCIEPQGSISDCIPNAWVSS